MDFTEFLRTCIKSDGSSLSERSIEHYYSGLKVTSDDMLREGVISKPLQNMNLYELDLAIILIRSNPFFEAKDKKGKRMYSNSLKHYRLYMFTIVGEADSAKEEINSINNNANLSVTERQTLIQARVGQGMYREGLLKKYHSRCIITQINLPEILIASHIKPWSVSDNQERITPENGLLLSATYDRLFDQGLISFENDGRILLSSMITTDNAQKLKIDNGKKYDIQYNPSMKDFLAYHRDVIFVK